MTVKLLIDWKDSRDGKQYIAGNLLTTDAGTESGLVAAKLADTNLTGGTAYVAPTEQTQYEPVMASRNLTGMLRISGRMNAEIIKGKIGRSPLRVSGIGNSIMVTTLPWFVHACDQSNGLFVAIDKGAGVAGNSTSQMAARVADVSANADIVFIMECTNDAAFMGNADHRANMISMIEFYLGRGQLPVVCLPPRRSDDTTLNNRTMQLAMIDYFLAKQYDIPVYDPWRIFVNAADGKLSAGAGSSDGKHPGDVGHYLAGTELLAQILGTSHTLPLPMGNTTYGGAGLVPQPLFLSNWGASGAGAGVVYSAASNPAPGNSAVITGSGAGTYSLQYNCSTGFQDGDILAVVARLAQSGGSAGSAVFTASCAPAFSGGGIFARTMVNGFSGLFYGEMTVPVGTTTVFPYIQAINATDGKILTVSQVQIYNKTALLNR